MAATRVKQTRSVSPPPLALWQLLCGALIILTGLFLALDSAVRASALRTVTDVQTTDWTPPKLSAESGGRYRTAIPPVTSMDGRWWIVYAEDMLRQGSFRVRDSARDNAPQGREVHWSSLPMWILAGMATVGGSPDLGTQLERVAERSVWFGPFTLVLGLMVFGFIFGRELGLGGFTVFLVAFCLSPLTFQGFRAGEVDHHGLVLIAIAVSVLALAIAPLRASAGKPTGRWAITSGVAGGLALWMSASSFLPVLGAMGLAVFVGSCFGLLPKMPPATWRQWARAGAVTSLLCYALEYFPNAMGWRLEVNHPLYALAWFAAGELLWRIHDRSRSGRPWTGSEWVGSILLTAVIVAPGLVIAALGSRVFTVADPFLLELHKQFIREFQSLATLIANSGTTAPWFEVLTLPTIGIVLLILLMRQRPVVPGLLAALLLCGFPVLVSQALGVLQIRWLLVSGTLWAVWAALAVALLASGKGLPRAAKVLGGVGLLILFAGLPLASARDFLRLGQSRTEIPKEPTIPSIIARDIAWRLSQATRPRHPIVLASPNLSTEMSYFADVRTIGTLYWENIEGLRAAAALFSAPDEETFRSLFESRAITHIVVPSWDDFSSAYGSLPGISSSEPYLARIISGAAPIPNWLRPLFYPIPEAFGLQGSSVAIFAYHPEQTEFTATMNVIRFLSEKGDTAKALTLLETAESLSPGDPEISILRANLLKANQNP